MTELISIVNIPTDCSCGDHHEYLNLGYSEYPSWDGEPGRYVDCNGKRQYDLPCGCHGSSGAAAYGRYGSAWASYPCPAHDN